jgi:regulator of protease activity HflC (stomatin/prohibitin superfamily)
MRFLGLSIVFSLFLISSATAAKRAMPSGQVAHSRRAPVAMHRMSPPYRGNHVYEKPQPEARQARAEREASRAEREASRAEREASRAEREASRAEREASRADREASRREP